MKVYGFYTGLLGMQDFTGDFYTINDMLRALKAYVRSDDVDIHAETHYRCKGDEFGEYVGDVHHAGHNLGTIAIFNKGE